ncbi:MAG: ectoine synthase, partial [Desulfatibacillaceae bacterium]|nr:ectoine synthase [Desulfatibacillaceae bacterium]
SDFEGFCMIVRSLFKIQNTKRDVTGKSGNWTSRRLLLKEDGMGFSLHDTIIRAGTITPIWYKNHLEAVYCIEGSGEIELVEGGEKIPIEPGVMYALNGHERHLLRAWQDMRLICVFNPALTGREDHDKDGAYPLLEE